jgi:hypothetical protein
MKTLGMLVTTPGIDLQATVAMVIIATFGFEVIRVLVKDDRRR